MAKAAAMGHQWEIRIRFRRLAFAIEPQRKPISRRGVPQAPKPVPERSLPRTPKPAKTKRPLVAPKPAKVPTGSRRKNRLRKTAQKISRVLAPRTRKPRPRLEPTAVGICPVTVYPSIFRTRYPGEDRTVHQQDACAIARSLSETSTTSPAGGKGPSALAPLTHKRLSRSSRSRRALTFSFFGASAHRRDDAKFAM